MSLYRISNDNFIIQKYLNKNSHQNARVMSSEEILIALELRDLINSGYRLARTLGCYMVVLQRLPENFYDVISNLTSARKSIEKQSGLAFNISKTFQNVSPDDKELQAIKRFVAGFDKRQRWVKKTVISAAIELSPMQEYIEIVGWDTFNTELREAVNHSAEKEDAEKLCDKILKTTSHHHVGEQYRERLNVYLRNTARIKEIAKTDKEVAREKTAQQNREDSEELTFKCLNKLMPMIKRNEEYKPLGFGRGSLDYVLRKMPISPVIVVVGYVYRNKFYFKYMMKDGKLANGFGSAHPYTEETAVNIAREYMESHPGRYATTINIDEV